MLDHPAEGRVVRRCGQAIQQPASRQRCSPGAHRGHDSYPFVHGAQPVEHRRDRFRIAGLIEQRPGPGTARHDKEVQWFPESLSKPPIRHDPRSVRALHLGNFAGNEHNLKRVWRHGCIVGAEKTRYGEWLDKAEDVDRFEAVEYENADPLGSGNRCAFRHPFPPLAPPAWCSFSTLMIWSSSNPLRRIARQGTHLGYALRSSFATMPEVDSPPWRRRQNR